MTIHTRLSGSIAAAALGLTAVLGTATPAAAGPPEINQKDCEAANGTFDRVKGVKSCATTATSSQSFGPFVNIANIAGVNYEATWMEQWISQVTTTRSQKGNGEVTIQQTSPVLLSRTVFNQECETRLFGILIGTDVQDCQAQGLYPAY